MKKLIVIVIAALSIVACENIKPVQPNELYDLYSDIERAEEQLVEIKDAIEDYEIEIKYIKEYIDKWGPGVMGNTYENINELQHILNTALYPKKKELEELIVLLTKQLNESLDEYN